MAAQLRFHDVTPSPPRPLGERERFVAFAFAAADLLLEVGRDGGISFAAGATRARFGRTPAELVGTPVLDLIGPEDRGSFARAIALLPGNGRLAPTRFRLADGVASVASVSGLCLGPAGGPISLAIAAIPNMPESAPHDAEALLTAARSRLAAGGAGSAIGLIEFAEPRGSDTSDRARAALLEGQPDGAVLAQLGPGRLGLLAAPGQAPLDLQEVARRLEPVLQSKVAGAVLTLDGEALTGAQAARALRHALAVFGRSGTSTLPSDGEGTVGLSAILDDVMGRAAGLRRAIAMRRFHLEFQPIVALDTRHVHHFEALLRPGRNVLGQGGGAQELVLLAETAGLTAELDIAVLDEALKATPALAPGQRIAVNLSGLSVEDVEFRQQVLAMLDAAPDAAARLMVELTESAEIENEAAARETLTAIRDRGLPVCLDDFGAGAAAFRYLKAFAVDYVKVDGSYVAAARTRERERSFVSAMVDLSIAVGAKVVAERIETEEDAALMARLGVHCGQGWLFGRPGPIPRYEREAHAVARRRGGQEQWG